VAKIGELKTISKGAGNKPGQERRQETEIETVPQNEPQKRPEKARKRDKKGGRTKSDVPEGLFNKVEGTVKRITT